MLKHALIVGAHVGDRSETGAKALWRSLPPVYRQCAMLYRLLGSLRDSATKQAASCRWQREWIDQSD